MCKPLPATVVRTPAPHRRSKVPATADGLPRRSLHVAAQGKLRVSNAEVQAQNVLMGKWEATSEKRAPDVDAIGEYNSIF